MHHRAPRRHRLTVLAATLISVIASSMSGAVALAAPAPDTVIDTKPTNPSNVSGPTFTFHSTKSGSTFSCQVDGASYAVCTSPKTYSGLSQGSHTFFVRATWHGTTDPSAASYTWTIDTTAPSVPTNLTGSAPTSTAATLNWTASTDNLALAGYHVYRDAVLLATIGLGTSYTDSTVVAGMTYTYTLDARDTAGNNSAQTAGVPVNVPIPPNTFIDSAPLLGTTSTDATLTFHADLSGATFTCKLDGAAAAPCISPQTYNAITEAQHTFTVYATVNGLDDPTPANASWTVDLTPPNAPTNLAASLTTATSAQLTWTAATDAGGIAGYNVFRDGAPLTTLGLVTTYTDNTITSGATPAYALQAIDIAGNLSSLTAPVVALRPLSTALTRMPYLTDLVGLNATVNFGTNTSSLTATVQFGTPSGSSCTITNTVSATRISIIVGAVSEYQWKAPLTLPSAGTYCYRPFLGATDLLGSNASPTFQTQVPLGSSESFTFDVFGDWGQVDVNGQNANEANLMHQIALSGARFAITTGDQGYPDGSQGTYGDIRQVGSNLSGIFGAPFWASVGSTLPIFATIGNHGFARSDAVHPHFANWPADVAVATSGGRAQIDAYPSVNGTNAASYPSAWYAFSAGTARFYLLTAAWADLNVGTSTAYGNDYASHWTSSSPEYQWLQADLAAHPSELKFAFLHYPFYSDQDTETSNTFLQGDGSLEGLLAFNGVALAFSGHAHIYQRNAAPTGRLGLVSYITGGGGADAESTVSTCSAIDQYAVGWSDTKGKGTACGAAPMPTSRAQIFHFLKVTISGSTITVTPTDSTGQTFDVQSYSFGQAPDTYIDTAPPAGTSSASADFTFHATSPTATYTCTLDAGAPTSCTSPKSYASLAEGSHTFTVYATVNGVADPLPATWTWTVDATAPGAPTGFAAAATSPSSVGLSWTAAIDNLGVTGYEVYRDGSLLATIAPATTYTDNAVVGGTIYAYKVRARDAGGNTSQFTSTITVPTPSAPAPVWADGFEAGSFSAWTSSSGLTAQSSIVNNGSFAARGTTSAVGPYAKETLPSTYPDGYARAWFLVQSQTSQVNLLRLRDAAGASIGFGYISASGQLGFRNDTTGLNTLSSTVPGPGWHALELHILTGGVSGAVGVWLDNVQIAALSTSVTTSVNPIGQLQIGETQATGQVYDVVFDDVAFGTARLGPVPDAAPSKPAGLGATAISASQIDLSWSASTDDLGVVGYDVLRGGSVIASIGNVTVYSDTSALPSTTYTYNVRARDTSGNRSPLSDPASATTPAAAVAIFSDGFETGNLSKWTSSGGIGVETTNVNGGTYAAEANTVAGATYGKKLLPSTYTSGYLRAYVQIVSTVNQLNVLRFRTATDASIGYLYVTTGGKLGLKSDSVATGTLSTASFAFGTWHSLEVHFTINGTSGGTEVWLDGSPVAALSMTVNLGTTAIGKVQIGEVNASGTWDVVYDDVAFNTSRVGP